MASNEKAGHADCLECGEDGCGAGCTDDRCREPVMLSSGIHEDCERPRALRLAYEHYTCPDE